MSDVAVVVVRACSCLVGDDRRSVGSRRVASGEAKQMLGLEEDQRRGFRFQVAFLRFDDEELDILPVGSGERLGNESSDLLVL